CARPLRLTPAEGLALLAAGVAVSAAPGFDPLGPLARALGKLSAVLGVDPDESVEVELGDASSEILGLVQEAASSRRRVEVDYYSYGRDAWSRRVIQPARVFNSAGHWYVASGDRLFRVDRMRDPKLLDSRFRRPKRAPASVYNPRKTDPLLV